MQERLFSVARRLWPALIDMPSDRRAQGVGEVVAFLLFAPISIAGMLWLAASTDVDHLRANLGLLVLIAALVILLGRYQYFVVTRFGPNRYGRTEGSLNGVVLFSGLLLLGPVVLWIAVLQIMIQMLTGWDQATNIGARWSVLRQGIMELATETIAPLLALDLYLRWGGSIPIDGLEPASVALALGAVGVNFAVQIGLSLSYLAYNAWSQRQLSAEPETQAMIGFFLLAVALPHLAHPFGILAAGLYVDNGLLAYLFFAAALTLVAVLTRRLSWEAERSKQQSSALRQLEGISHDIINAVPDADRLPRILEHHLPQMFAAASILVWRFPEQILYKRPIESAIDLDQIWPWLATQSEATAILPDERLPWDERANRHAPVIVVPVLERQDLQPIGGIHLALPATQPWDKQAMAILVPALQSLASLIASEMSQVQTYAVNLQFERLAEQVRLAGEIQFGLIPFEIPRVPGWQLAVTLNPAEETSGDFFDIIPFPDGRLGLVIADVVDKGVGAALYMAVSRTLLRTYALEADPDPDLVFFATNARMLADISSPRFVTAFYGVLDPEQGKLTYSNAGHNPPFVFRSREQVIIQELIRTGFPIGLRQDATWTKATVQLQPGDRLVLYTDGIPDARNPAGDLLTVQPILDIAKANLDLSVEGLQTKLLDQISEFVADAPQSDDITLMILGRDPVD